MAGQKLEKTSGFLSRCAYGVCLIILLLTAVLFIDFAPEDASDLALALLCALVAVPLLWLCARCGERLGWKWSLTIILGLCFAVRLAWVVLVPIEPTGDYLVFYDHADYFSRLETLEAGRYMALFPHIFGYSWFLSLFFKVLGPSPMLAAVINVALSTLSCALLFFLCRRLGGDKAAVWAGLLWTCFPSQIIYNMFTLSEPLYTTGILGFLLLLSVFEERLRGGRLAAMALLGGGAGVILALVNLCRPVSAILIVALALWLTLVRLDGWRERSFRRGTLVFLAATLVCYMLVGALSQGYIAYRIGEEPASTPGYNILVGFNPQSNGAWNQADSDLLYFYSGQEGATAADAQGKMLEEAKARITSGTVHFGSLFRNKLYLFLGRDDSCVMYASSVINHRDLFSSLCNVFYYMTFLLAAVGTVDALRRRDRTALFPVMLYLVGLTMAHMLVEVAGRYHYSLLIPLVVLAGRGVGVLIDLGLALTARVRRKK